MLWAQRARCSSASSCNSDSSLPTRLGPLTEDDPMRIVPYSLATLRCNRVTAHWVERPRSLCPEYERQRTASRHPYLRPRTRPLHLVSATVPHLPVSSRLGIPNRRQLLASPSWSPGFLRRSPGTHRAISAGRGPEAGLARPREASRGFLFEGSNGIDRNRAQHSANCQPTWPERNRG